MALRPAEDCIEQVGQFLPKLCQPVFDPGRNDGINLPLNEAIAFEHPQGLRQHLWCNPLDPAFELAETDAVRAQRTDYEMRPFIRQDIKDGLRWARSPKGIVVQDLGHGVRYYRRGT